MGNEWIQVTVEEVAEIFDGPHATPKKTDSGPVFLGISNLVNGRIDSSTVQHLSEDDYKTWTRRITPEAGDIVFSYETRLGEAAAIPYGLRCCLGRRMGLLRPRRESVDPRFLLYAYLGPEFQETLQSRAVQGSTVDRILLSELGTFPIRTPPLPKQRAIAHVLGTLDDKIELNRRMNRTLEEIARAIFKDWFVDFGPTRAKMEGLDPYLPSELWDLFPDELVDSELGEIPEGWETKPLDEIATFLNGLALQKYPPNEGPSLPVIKIAQLRAGHTQGADSASVDVPSKYHIHDGDVLFSWSGSLELDIWTGGEGALNQHLFKVDSDVYPKWLYYHWVREYLQVFRAIAADKATTMGHIQRRHLSESHTVLPDSAALEAMNRLMLPLLDKSTALRMTSRTVALLRDALLPQIMSGDISINLLGAA